MQGFWRDRTTRAGAGLLLVALTVSSFAFVLQTANAATKLETATITRQAYFTHPITEVAPPLLFGGFPPGTACLVAGLVGVPQVCGEDIQQIVALIGLTQGIPVIVTPDSYLIQPVVPGTTPVGMLGGQERYATALQFRLPALPEGQTFGSLELILHQDGLQIALESPAFRQLVFAVINQVGEQDPEALAADLERVISMEAPLLAQNVTGIEACPILEGWNAGDAQDAALDGTRLPDSNCIQGTTGVFNGADGTWTFDLTFAAQAWTTPDETGKTLANNGIIFRPAGAPNLAYGDPDLSTNFVISLADGDATGALSPQLRYTTTAAPDAGPGGSPVTPPAGGPVSGDGSSEGPELTGGGGSTGTGDAGAGAGGGGQTSSDDLAGEAGTAGGRAAGTPAWVFLLLPIGLIGVYLFGESLFATPDIVARRPGALSRMIEQATRLSAEGPGQ